MCCRVVVSGQLRRVEQTIASVGGATAGEFGVGKAKCNKMNVGAMCECLVKTAPKHRIRRPALAPDQTWLQRVAVLMGQQGTMEETCHPLLRIERMILCQPETRR